MQRIKGDLRGQTSVTKKINAATNTNVLTMSAIALALSVVSLLLFRGPISILSAFIIPAVLVLFTSGERKTFPFTAIGLIIMTGLFFQTQIVFVPGYLFLALFLRRFFMDSEREMKVSLAGVLLYIATVMLILWIGIQLTQMIFLIPLQDMMLRLSGHDPLRYAGILFAEGAAITLFNLLLLKAFLSRIKVLIIS